MNYKLQMYRTDQGTKPVMVGPPGRKLLPILIIESSGVTVLKVPLSEQRFLFDSTTFKNYRSMKSAAKHFKAVGKRLGMTKAAKSFLSKAINAA